MNESPVDNPENMKEYKERAAAGRAMQAENATAVAAAPEKIDPNEHESTKRLEPVVDARSLPKADEQRSFDRVSQPKAGDPFEEDDDDEDDEVIIAGRPIPEEVIRIINQNAAFLSIRALYHYVANGRLPQHLGMDFKYVPSELGENEQEMYDEIAHTTRAELLELAESLDTIQKYNATNGGRKGWPADHFMYALQSAVDDLGNMITKFEDHDPKARTTGAELRDIAYKTLAGFANLLAEPVMAGMGGNWLQAANFSKAVDTMNSGNLTSTGRHKSSEPNLANEPKKASKYRKPKKPCVYCGQIHEDEAHEVKRVEPQKKSAQSPLDRVLKYRDMLAGNKPIKPGETLDKSFDEKTHDLKVMRKRIQLMFKLTTAQMGELDSIIAKAKLARIMGNESKVHELSGMVIDKVANWLFERQQSALNPDPARDEKEVYNDGKTRIVEGHGLEGLLHKLENLPVGLKANVVILDKDGNLTPVESKDFAKVLRGADQAVEVGDERGEDFIEHLRRLVGNVKA